ncbi:class I SAM-dependent methyltransferase [Marinicella gelatinilytica]|uniref:class I SAM-dependent methyltransferase n=1 Tax=Marinicella gelatinilytica TaxID=2996017 RepID=UPI002260F3FD|nr:class I SAM-dependent methyltransferase [Marinicella gelatinilytica]MCX7544497.1 class I SAM-dependent methyltransferase [Marinicella gelatinilytica]
MSRGYQHGFSENDGAMFEKELRQRKANTMVRVFEDYIGGSKINELSLLNVGGSAGIIDEYLSRYFKHVTGVDIDEKAIEFAKSNFNKENLSFDLGDAMNLPYDSEKFDVVVCSQVYEHVPDAAKMMNEIYRVLVPGGLVYFAASNRLMFNEPHYNLPMLSVIPRPLAHIYLRALGRGKYYYEKHYSYWGLKSLIKRYSVTEYTKKLVCEPEKFGVSYMIRPSSFKQSVAKFIASYLNWLTPGYIWILKKP